MMNGVKKIVLVTSVIILVAMLILVSVVVLRTRQSTNLPAQEAVSLRLNWVPQAQFAGIYVAREKGFYRDVGLSVEIKGYEQDLDQTKEVADGTSDFGISTGSEVIVARAKGIQVKSVAAIYNTTPESFISLASSSIRSPADFKGKILGSKGGNKEGLAIYEALLRQAGLGHEDVTYQTLDYSQTVPEDLVNHRADVVDAYRTDETYQMEKAGLAYNIITPETYNIEVYGDTIITAQRNIDERPDVVKRFVAATLRGWEYAIAHEEETLRIIAPFAHEDYQDAHLEQNILKESIQLVKPTRGSVVGMMQFAKWNKAIKQLEAAGLIEEGVVNAKDVYSTTFIPAASVDEGF